jgi:hypothetical protein
MERRARFGCGQRLRCDNYIRQMLDGATPAVFDGLFGKAVQAAGPLTPFQCLGGRVLIALDGTEHFCSRRIKCRRCSTRRRADGGTEYFHTFLGASLVAPGHKQVLPLPPQFIAPQDGAEKQDCERNAAKRWLARLGPGFAHLRPIYPGDDLFACQPIAAAIHDAGGNFILTCKPSSHKTITEYLQGVELAEHRQTVCKRGKRTTTIYRWLNALPWFRLCRVRRYGPPGHRRRLDPTKRRTAVDLSTNGKYP